MVAVHSQTVTMDPWGFPPVTQLSWVGLSMLDFRRYRPCHQERAAWLLKLTCMLWQTNRASKNGLCIVDFPKRNSDFPVMLVYQRVDHVVQIQCLVHVSSFLWMNTALPKHWHHSKSESETAFFILVYRCYSSPRVTPTITAALFAQCFSPVAHGNGICGFHQNYDLGMTRPNPDPAVPSEVFGV